MDQIAQAMGGGSFSADVSDSSKISVTVGDGAMEGNYSIEVLDAGSYATSMSTSAWTADAGSVHTYAISLSGVSHSLTVADNSVGSVAAAINSQYGDQVRATVVKWAAAIDGLPDLVAGFAVGGCGAGADLQRNRPSDPADHRRVGSYEVNGSGKRSPAPRGRFRSPAASRST